MSKLHWVMALAAGAACVAGVAVAQPDRGADRPPGPQAEDAPVGLPAIRERIQQRREQLRRAQERIDLAMKRMDEGATVEQLQAEYPEFFRPRPGMAGGPEGFDGHDGLPGGPGGRRPGMRGGEGPDGLMGGPDGPDRFDRSGGPGGPGGMGERGRDRAGSDRAPTDEERAAIREFLRVAQPRLYELLQDLEEHDPAEAKRKLTEAFPRVRPLLDLRKSDPEMFELRMKDLRNGREAMESARWLAQHQAAESGASESENARRREAMRAALRAQFDARTEIQRRDYARQAERLTEAQAELEKRAGDRDSTVEAMMARMIEREAERIRRGEGPDDGPLPGEPGRRPGRRGDR